MRVSAASFAQSRANRPCSALCLNCRAISVALRTRSRKNASSGVRIPHSSDVHPHRRIELELDEERAAQDEKAQDEDGEHGGAVAGVGEGIAQAAALALLAQPQTSPEQRTPAAARTARLEAGGEDGGGGRWFGHAGCRSFFCSQCATLDVGASGGRAARHSGFAPLHSARYTIAGSVRAAGMTTEPLPRAADAEHLTAALRRCGALGDGRVRDVVIESRARRYSSHRSATADLRWCVGAPSSLILKTGLPDRGLRLGHREVGFYTQVAAVMPARLVPRCFEAVWDRTPKRGTSCSKT